MRQFSNQHSLRRTITRTTVAAAVVVMFGAPTAQAQPEYGAANWTDTGIAGGTTGITDVPTAVFGYHVKLGNPGGPVSYRTATFSNTAAGTGTVTFDWYYTGFHAFFQAQIQLQVFANTTAGGLTVIDLYPLGGASQASPAGTFLQTGRASIAVEAGMEWGIITGGQNSDSNGNFRGNVHMVNLTGPVAASATTVGLSCVTSPYDPSNWTSSGITGGDTSIESGTAVQLSYDVNLGNPGPGVSLRDVTYSVNAPGSGNSRLAWFYSGSHAQFMPQNLLTLNAETSGGPTSITLKPLGPSGVPFFLSGVNDVTIETGFPVGFTAGGSNFDSNSRIRGTVTVIMGGPVAPAPACETVDIAAPIGTVDILDMLQFLSIWFPSSAAGACP